MPGPASSSSQPKSNSNAPGVHVLCVGNHGNSGVEESISIAALRERLNFAVFSLVQDVCNYTVEAYGSEGLENGRAENRGWRKLERGARGMKERGQSIPQTTD